MEYFDEQILKAEDYERIAKAYNDALKKKGLMIVERAEVDKKLIEEAFSQMQNIKSLLFSLGGFMNTSKFYSLNERQISKLALIFDLSYASPQIKPSRDKTKNFISFIAHESMLIKNLITLSEQSSFECAIKNMINDRLSLLSTLLSFYC